MKHNEPSQSAQQSGWQHYPAESWEQHKPVNWLHDWEFWQWCADTYAHDKRILELACGNGRITRQLALSGYSVVAVDLNPHFLSRAVQHLPEQVKDKVQFLLQDMVSLEVDEQFSLAIMADWAFPALLTQQDQLTFFKRLSDHLNIGGVFAFNMPLPTVQQLGLENSEDQQHLEWKDDKRSFDAVTQIEAKQSGSQTIYLRHTTLYEIQLLGLLTGFEIIAQFGGTDRRRLLGIPDDDLTLILRKAR